jgi:hypothetical protein
LKKVSAAKKELVLLQAEKAKFSAAKKAKIGVEEVKPVTEELVLPQAEKVS